MASYGSPTNTGSVIGNITGVDQHPQTSADLIDIVGNICADTAAIIAGSYALISSFSKGETANIAGDASKLIGRAGLIGAVVVTAYESDADFEAGNYSSGISTIFGGIGSIAGNYLGSTAFKGVAARFFGGLAGGLAGAVGGAALLEFSPSPLNEDEGSPSGPTDVGLSVGPGNVAAAYGNVPLSVGLSGLEAFDLDGLRYSSSAPLQADDQAPLAPLAAYYGGLQLYEDEGGTASSPVQAVAGSGVTAENAAPDQTYTSGDMSPEVDTLPSPEAGMSPAAVTRIRHRRIFQPHRAVQAGNTVPFYVPSHSGTIVQSEQINFTTVI